MYGKRKRIVAVILIVCVVIISVLSMLLSYDGYFYTSEEEEILNKVEEKFNIKNVEYKEILYFMPFSGGPLGEGDSCLVLKLTPKSADAVADALRHNKDINKFPMDSEISEYAYSNMYIESASYHMSELKNGFYGFYSKFTDKLLPYQQLLKTVTTGEDIYLLNSYWYIQYDVEEEILYIWEYG